MRNILLLVITCLSFQAQAQIPDAPLPRYATDLERMEMARAPVVVSAFGETDPPATPVRSMAEWEELQALVVTWRSHPAILTEIVRAAQEECRVVISCATPQVMDAAKGILVSSGVDTSSNVEFILAPSNSIWIRDYGPNSVYANDVDSLFFVDWRYNRNTRRRDDTLATTLAPYFNVPLYTTSIAPNDLVHTGGNFMSDGMGTSFSSNLILDENAPGNPYGASPKSLAQVEDIMNQYMGVKRYVLMEKLPYDGIHHIDMHMKVLDEQTLLVGEYPMDIADGPQIEANIQYVLSNYMSSFGTPYKVVRIPMPPDFLDRYPDQGGDYRTYANSVFVNKTIIVPFYEEKYDTTAQRIWEQAMPGYKVVGVDCNDIIPSLGAIHCITKEVGVPDPLRIVHRQLDDVEQNTTEPDGYFVSATVQHRSGIASARVWYTTDTSAAWQSVNMNPSLDSNDVWEAEIPRIDDAVGKYVYYYIEADAANGKQQVRPMPAPQGWWRFRVTEKMASSVYVPAAANLQKAFPNPASAITCVPLNANAPAKIQLGLYDSFGRLVESLHEGDIPSGTSRFFFDAGAHPSGVYWLRLMVDGKVQAQSIVLQ